MKKTFNVFGLKIGKNVPVLSQIGTPGLKNAQSIKTLNLNAQELVGASFFKTDRYYWINEYRWRLLLQTGMPIEGSTIFEPGAGIGDQTQFLLSRGAKKIIVSEGRETNLSIIRKRFNNDNRVEIISDGGDLEKCLDRDEFSIRTDFIFLWGVYYHILDPIPQTPVLKKLALISPTIILDYQESTSGMDHVETYGYDSPSTSMSQASWRQTRTTMIKCVRDSFGYVYFPIEPMDWNDPACITTPRRIIIGSKTPLDWVGIVEAE